MLFSFIDSPKIETLLNKEIMSRYHPVIDIWVIASIHIVMRIIWLQLEYVNRSSGKGFCVLHWLGDIIPPYIASPGHNKLTRNTHKLSYESLAFV